MNILVADDDRDMRNMLSTMLVKRDYTIELAENGMEAVHKVGKKMPDLILMDLKMPVMDGITAIKEIRKHFKTAMLPIILLSVETDRGEWVKALSAGANDFVLKPYHKSELLARIKTHIEVSDLTNKLANTTKELTQKNLILKKEKLLAGKVQKVILPHKLSFKGLDVESLYNPSDQISGDFFDAFRTNNSLVFAIGDVSGHGTASALIMATVKGMIHSLGHTFHTSLEVITVVNRILCDMLGDSGLFLTLIYSMFDEKKEELKIISAGHNPVFIFAEGKIKTVESTGPPLGWDTDDSWEITRVPFRPNNSLFLYTDGLVEARNSKKEEFGQQRLLKILQKSLTPKEQIANVFQEAAQFCNKKFEDDVTMFAIRRNS